MTDPVKSPALQLVEAINSKYRKQLEVSHVEFGTPQENPDSESPHNTIIEINGAEGQPYEFTTVLQFTRLSLEDVFFGHSRAFGGVITHTHDLVPELASRLNLPITVDDIVGHSIESTHFPQSMLLTAAPRSLLLHGEVTIQLTGL